MSSLELGGKRFPIPVGEVTLGSDAGCAVTLGGAGVLPRHALLEGQADGQVVIRKASPAAEVLINGVRLGAEPTPLLHGDKVEVGDHELTFVDERRSGSTQYVKAFAPASDAGAPRAGAGGGGGGAKPVAVGTTGGRLVSLTDGREYVITGASLVFGREAGCDVVVSGNDVSRRHAEIVHTPKGYLLVDSSTNGTFVNEERVQGQRILARADVIRLGEEQFRFYADVAPVPAVPARDSGLTSPPPAPAPAAAAASAPSPPEGAENRLRRTVHGMEAAVPPQPAPAPGSLATLLVRNGTLIGRRLAVKTPIVNVGRADYNDIVVPDPSVSTSHAKLQRREGVWVLVDLDSTNGTFVDGERVRGEAPLAPGAMVRFGDIQLMFEPTDDAMVVTKGGGTQVLKTPHSLPPTPPPPKAPVPRPPVPAKGAAPVPPKVAPPPRPAAGRPPVKRPVAQQPPAKKGKGCGSSAAVLVLGTVGLAFLLHRLLA
jgi:pSer/pThr/pTyr-binding forkhead associated (FHA) protein